VSSLPIAVPQKIICVGLNYRDHADEGAVQAPERPILFAKWPNTLIGPNTPIILPASVTQRVDLEGELGVVIGRTARRSRVMTRSTSSAATYAPTTSARATFSSATASGPAANPWTHSAPSVPRSCSKPLRPAGGEVLIRSGAAVSGSPLSAGYAGAKATQGFITG
jgi:hypothetical protein